MAGGRTLGKFEVAIGLIGVLALLTTVAIVTQWNPLPGIQDWLNRRGSLSEPNTAWVQRLGAQPTRASIVSTGQVVLHMRDVVEARDASSGNLLWERKADWAVSGGDVVVVDAESGPGYVVIDPSTGQVMWSDDKASGVWAYEDRILDLHCGEDNCTVRSRTHGQGGRVQWSTTLASSGKTLKGGNPELPGIQPPSRRFSDAVQGSPGFSPAVVGFGVEHKVQVVDVAQGKRVRDAEPPDRQTLIVVAGGRVIHSRAVRDGSSCRFTVEAYDPDSGQSVWKREGYDLKTSSGAGCEQRDNPVGGGGMILATRGDNRPALLNAADGSEAWVGTVGEKLLATDVSLAVVATADGKSVKLIDLLAGGRSVGSHPAGKRAEAAVTPHGVMIYDPDSEKLTALGRNGSVLADVETDASVIGYGISGLVLANGRSVGVLRFGTIGR